MSERENLRAICRRVGARLRALARSRAFRALSEEDFVQAVLQVEADEVTPHGLTLAATNTRDGWTVFVLRISGRKEVCDTFEFHPVSGEFRKATSRPE